MESHYHIKNKEQARKAFEEIKIIGLSIVSIDTPGVICSFTPSKERVKGEYGLTTDYSILLHLSDGRIISVYCGANEETYQGFSIVVNPKPFAYERDNKMNVSGFLKDCLNKTIVSYKTEAFNRDEEWINENESITSESIRALTLVLKDGTELSFSDPIMDGYMDCSVKL